MNVLVLAIVALVTIIFVPDVFVGLVAVVSPLYLLAWLLA